MGVRTEIIGNAAVVTMDWPKTRNALGLEESDALAEAIRAAASQPVCGIVLTGNQDSFCAGGNIQGASNRTGMPDDERRRIVYGKSQGLMRSLIESPIPTVAAIDGPAIGMGLDLALYCDSRFVGPGGWIMQGWGRVGLIPGTGGELLLRRLAPGLLWSLLESQPKLGQADAQRLGLAESSGDRPALERAIERIEKLSAMGREALESYVQLYRSELRSTIEGHLAMSVEAQLRVLRHPEFKARVSRALGKA